MEPDTSGWSAYERQVMSTLERLEEGQTSLSAQVQAVDKRLVVVEVRASLFGTLGGALAYVAGLFLKPHAS